MRISIILGHPRRESFCHAIAAVASEMLAANSHDVVLHDLYSEGFDPLMRADEAVARVTDDPLVEQHCLEVAAAEGLIVVHPSWWGMPPAILKGWIDRVIRPGVAYDLEADSTGSRTRHVGRLKVRTALVFNTADTPLVVEQSKFGDTLGLLWQSYIAALCGIPDLRRISFGVMGTSTPAQRTGWLDEVRTSVAEYFPMGRVE